MGQRESFNCRLQFLGLSLEIFKIAGELILLSLQGINGRLQFVDLGLGRFKLAGKLISFFFQCFRTSFGSRCRFASLCQFIPKVEIFRGQFLFCRLGDIRLTLNA